MNLASRLEGANKYFGTSIMASEMTVALTGATPRPGTDLARRIRNIAPLDRAAVLHAARMFYRLYGDVFRALPRADAAVTSDSRVAA